MGAVHCTHHISAINDRIFGVISSDAVLMAPAIFPSDCIRLVSHGNLRLSNRSHPFPQSASHQALLQHAGRDEPVPSPSLWTDQLRRTLSDLGIPSDPMRLRTRYFSGASTCLVLERRRGQLDAEQRLAPRYRVLREALPTRAALATPGVSPFSGDAPHVQTDVPDRLQQAALRIDQYRQVNLGGDLPFEAAKSSQRDPKRAPASSRLREDVLALAGTKRHRPGSLRLAQV